MEHEIQRWFEYADADLGVAKHLLETYHPKPLEIICYHCQQAAEKAIKAMILAFDLPGGIPKKHDLTFLLNQLRGCVTIDSALRRHADMLNSYSIMVRYPAEILIDENTTANSIQYAEEIVNWAKRIVVERMPT